MKLVRATIESLLVVCPEPMKERPQGMCLDKGKEEVPACLEILHQLKRVTQNQTPPLVLVVKHIAQHDATPPGFAIWQVELRNLDACEHRNISKHMDLEVFASYLTNRERKGCQGGDKLLLRLISFPRRACYKVLRQESCQSRSIFGSQRSPQLLLDQENLTVR